MLVFCYKYIYVLSWCERKGLGGGMGVKVLVRSKLCGFLFVFFAFFDGGGWWCCL